MLSGLKIFRGALKQFVPFGLMRIWMERHYGECVDMPLFYYPGFAKRVKRIVKFLLPYGFVRRFARPFVSKPVIPADVNSLKKVWKEGQVTILCTRHVLYVARLFEHVLRHFGKNVIITTEEPRQYGNGAHVVICPQMFHALPDKFAAFQMEQTISSRWLTPEYLGMLNAAMPIFDYSQKNICFWRERNIPLLKLYYLPIDFLPDMRAQKVQQPYDVVFYGDPTSPRRQKWLDELKRRFDVHVISEVFGDELHRELAKAKVVVNVHYYDNAMLETTRLYEVLSLGCSVVVSERSCDSEEERRLEHCVDFVPVGDIEAMSSRIAHWLSDDSRRVDRVEATYRELSTRCSAFDYFFARFLLAFDIIGFDDFYRFAGNFVNFTGNRVCLSLPESLDRRQKFDSVNKYDFEVFPGLRHLRGWTGCGLSYKFIFRKAVELGLNRIMVCEDDVVFPEDFGMRLRKCEEYLATKGEWHVFQGMMADVGDVTVRNVEFVSGETFLLLDHMISTVFNIYSSSVYGYFLQWDEKNGDPEVNTIDRSLEGYDLNVVTTRPFLVGHDEGLVSDLWGLGNAKLYAKLIRASTKKLDKLIAEFLSRKSDG